MLTTVVQPLMTQFLFMFIAYTNANLQKIIKTPTYTMKCLEQELGYTPDWSLPFKFYLKSGGESRVLFYDEDGIACEILLGGWYNTQSYLGCYGTAAPKYRDKLVNHKLFLKFKIQYKDNAVQVYRHNDVKWIQILKLDNVQKFQPTRICLKTRWTPAEWIIYPPEENSSIRKAWKTKSTLTNIKILDEVVWKMEASNLGICTLLCNKDHRCMSFNFNLELNKCQGHSKNYYEVEGKNAKTESGAVHYYNHEI